MAICSVSSKALLVNRKIYIEKFSSAISNLLPDTETTALWHEWKLQKDV